MKYKSLAECIHKYPNFIFFIEEMSVLDPPFLVSIIHNADSNWPEATIGYMSQHVACCGYLRLAVGRRINAVDHENCPKNKLYTHKVSDKFCVSVTF